MALKLCIACYLLYSIISTEAFAPVTPRSPSSQLGSAKSGTPSNGDIIFTSSIARRSVVYGLAGLTISPLFLPTNPANARLEGVNKPALLPSEPGLNVIQVEKFLTKGQEKRMSDLLTKLEVDTGYRVRVLCQAYPRTPG